MEPLVSSQIKHGLGYKGFLLKLCDQIYFVFRFVTKENVSIQSQFQNSIECLIHCDRSPCKNNGSCILNSLNSTFICDCNDGFTG